MKYIYSLATAALLCFSVTSCDERLADLNIDPNNSPVASDPQILTASLGYMAAIQEQDLNEYSFLWGQYYTWGLGVAIGNADRFRQEASTNNNKWQRFYANALEDLNYLRKSESSSYSGIGKVLSAYNFQLLVDHYGDIPFSQALKGAIEDGSVLTPTYDPAADVYSGIITLIDDALIDFEVTAGDVGADDLLFAGDMDKWKKFAYSLKLKALMRTSEVSDNSAAITALLSNGTFIETFSDIVKVDFSGASGNQNPMWANMERSLGDFYFASNASVNVLNDLADPRIDAFYSRAVGGDFNGQFRGIDQGSVDNEPFTGNKDHYSRSGAFAVNSDNPVFFMTPWEVWFLRAEAEARYGSAATAETYFSNAISTNFSYLGVDGAAAYIATLNFSSLDMNGMIDAIGVQKWISMNGSQEDEGWIESRRFDRPASRLFTEGIFQTPTASALGQGVFPASWLYPASEINLNPNSPAQRVITDKIFWDN